MNSNANNNGDEDCRDNCNGKIHFCRVSQPSIMFSYKAQVDDAMDEDTVSLPHQQSFSSLKTDSDYIYQVHTPCFHAPLFHFQCLMKTNPKNATARLAGSSSHTTLLYPDYCVQRRMHPSARESIQTSAPDLRLLSLNPEAKRGLKDEAASVSNLLLSPSTASKFIFKPGSNSSKANLFSVGGNKSDQSLPVASTSGGGLAPANKDTDSTKLQSSLRNYLERLERCEEKKSAVEAAGLGEYLSQMRSSCSDEDDDNDVEVTMLPPKSKGSSSSSSRSEAL
jgi:hypothetical protein